MIDLTVSDAANNPPNPFSIMLFTLHEASRAGVRLNRVSHFVLFKCADVIGSSVLHPPREPHDADNCADITTYKGI